MRLVFYPDPILLTPAETIGEITDEVRSKAREMVPFMELEGGVGLAAPQVGWGVRLLLASEDGDPEQTQILINPRLVDASKETEWGEEGCLSFPEIYGEVCRHVAVTVEATDIEGQLFTVEAGGFFARVLQHEIDHLDGKLFIDKMRREDKLKNKELLMQLKDRWDSRQADRTESR